MDSRLIRAAANPAGWEPWRAPEVGAGAVRAAPRIEEQPDPRQQGWQEGFAEGRAAGLEAAHGQAAARTAALESALEALARPFEALDHRFHEEVLELVRVIARQLLRRETRMDPTHIIGVVRDGLAALPMAATEVRVRMHPEDAAIVRECLSPDEGERHWRLEADALMERGGCLIVTAQSQVDARLETRLGRVIAAMFEDERRDHADTPDTNAEQ